MIEAASDSGNADALVFFLFDLLFLDGEDLTGLPVSERKTRLATVIRGVGPPLRSNCHVIPRTVTVIPFYSMTRSARCSSGFGIWMPICSAAFKLTTSSYRLGSSTGSVAGSAPLAILSM
jgi:ATP dependent DNA ligase-like protein